MLVSRSRPRRSWRHFCSCKPESAQSDHLGVPVFVQVQQPADLCGSSSAPWVHAALSSVLKPPRPTPVLPTLAGLLRYLGRIQQPLADGFGVGSFPSRSQVRTPRRSLVAPVLVAGVFGRFSRKRARSESDFSCSVSYLLSFARRTSAISMRSIYAKAVTNRC